MPTIAPELSTIAMPLIFSRAIDLTLRAAMLPDARKPRHMSSGCFIQHRPPPFVSAR
jgi:hypothetical protein